MSRIVEIPWLYRGISTGWGTKLRVGYLRSFLAGTSISAGWLPCIGPTLGAILTLAIASGTILQSSVLLLVYSIGMAVPFVGIGVLLSRTPTVLRWMNRHQNPIAFASGLVMIAMGILLFTGSLQRLNGYFHFTTSGLGSRI